MSKLNAVSVRLGNTTTATLHYTTLYYTTLYYTITHCYRQHHDIGVRRARLGCAPRWLLRRAAEDEQHAQLARRHGGRAMRQRVRERTNTHQGPPGALFDVCDVMLCYVRL